MRCIDALNNYVNDKATLLSVGSFLIGGLLLIGVAGSLIIICCINPKSKDRKEIPQYKYDLLVDNII